jgi:hypothetical protein
LDVGYLLEGMPLGVAAELLGGEFGARSAALLPVPETIGNVAAVGGLRWLAVTGRC